MPQAPLLFDLFESTREPSAGQLCQRFGFVSGRHLPGKLDLQQSLGAADKAIVLPAAKNAADTGLQPGA